jgi:serine/threonine protein kinase
MAPEQSSDSHAVDIRADLYSLGCTLYKLLAGAAPFEDSRHTNAPQKIAAHAGEAPPPIGDRLPHEPPGLAVVLNRLLAKNPADRYATPAEAATAMARFCRGSDLAALLAAALHPAARQTDPQASRSTDPRGAASTDEAMQVAATSRKPAEDLPSTIHLPAPSRPTADASTGPV